MPFQLKGRSRYTIGVMSDSHGVLLHTAIRAFEGVDLIVHAGDIDTPDILDTLRALAPTVAVRGNMDRGSWAQKLNLEAFIQVDGLRLYVRHIFTVLDDTTLPDKADAVIYGHTHRAAIDRVRDTLFLNPGSAGQQRHQDPLSVALLKIEDSKMDFQLVPLAG